MKKKFEQYLIYKGYKTCTPNGKPSTVYDYIKRVDKICKWENMDWVTLAKQIKNIRLQYEIGGTKECLGKKSHNAVICALRQFEVFVSKKSYKR